MRKLRHFVYPALFMLCFGFCRLAFAGESSMDDLRQQLTESREANAMISEECAELRRQNAAQQKELTELRSRYASLLLETDQMTGKVTALELDAAHLVRGAENDAMEDDDAVRMLDILVECRQLLLRLENAMITHRETILAVLEASRASEPLQEQARNSLDGIFGKLNDSLEILGLATPAKLENSAGSCAILRLDQETQLVLLDQGGLHGIRNGQEFSLRRGDAILARLKVILLHPRNSVAILTEGQFQELTCGALLHRENQSPQSR